MPQQSSTPLLAPPASPVNDGPTLECATAGEAGEPGLRIRARRLYPVSREEVFYAWTRRPAWDAWFRLRSRSRTVLLPYRGGSYRLELAEGATIHVITGVIVDLRQPESLTLTWNLHGGSERSSIIELSVRERTGFGELEVVHSQIASRREAAWLMRVWSTVLRRLGEYLADAPMPAARRPDAGARKACAPEPEVRSVLPQPTYARSA